ncbi:HPr(Ser) kinase/phosphatase [Peptoniphilus equinus]|uniref:HPr kinase/phosphorylase n=1 Tax=Peptoniphilus equinus TaxID=3016343 RepID=A0ABY7QVB2_9FIRM|nr:HPr(Ser) kinase/phosphatase [Peptoniphilus equinus]WBW50724.1 HPr(Ser) kinase/phosphatase [Peptoniphilus equinus]
MDKIALSRIVRELNITILHESKNFKSTYIESMDLNRPGLQLTGYFRSFDNKRIQIIGEQEWHFLSEMDHDARYNCIKRLFETHIPAIIFLRNRFIHDEFIELAEELDVTLLRTEENFSKFTLRYQNYLEVELAPTIRVHGVLLDVFGVGVLIKGSSGVGKSETALDLISKGSKLISDDSVIIKRIDDRLIGKSPYITKHFMEIRGVGIIDVEKIFGIGFVMDQKNIEMVINLESWDDNAEYDRLGIDNVYEEILGKQLVKYNIPVKPGRNSALIIETATKNFKQKEQGYNPAEELNKRILGRRY